MLYGFPTTYENMNSTLIVAATTSKELDECLLRLKQIHTAHGFIRISFLELLSNPAFAGYKAYPIIVNHLNENERNEFLKELQIKEILSQQAIEHQLKMLDNDADEAKEPTETTEVKIFNGNTITRVVGEKTLAEIYGLDKDDPWDRKSDEEKESERLQREAYEKAQKEGRLSGPFQGKARGDIVIQDVRVLAKDDIRVEAIKFPKKEETAEEKEQRELLEMAGRLTPKQSMALARAVIFGEFTKDDYSNKLKEYEKQRLDMAKINLDPILVDLTPTNNPSDYCFAVYENRRTGVVNAAIYFSKYFENLDKMYERKFISPEWPIEGWNKESEINLTSNFEDLEEAFNDLRSKGFKVNSEFNQFMRDSGLDIFEEIIPE